MRLLQLLPESISPKSCRVKSLRIFPCMESFGSAQTRTTATSKRRSLEPITRVNSCAVPFSSEGVRKKVSRISMMYWRSSNLFSAQSTFPNLDLSTRPPLLGFRENPLQAVRPKAKSATFPPSEFVFTLPRVEVNTSSPCNRPVFSRKLIIGWPYRNMSQTMPLIEPNSEMRLCCPRHRRMPETWLHKKFTPP